MAAVERQGLKGFGVVDRIVIRDPGLSPNVKLVYAYLTTFCGDEREAFPSRARIARETGLSVRTVDKANKEAQAVGLWVVEKRESGGEWHSNKYLLRDLGGGFQSSAQGGSAGGALPRGAGDAPPSAAGAHEEDSPKNTTSFKNTKTKQRHASSGGAHAEREHAPRTPFIVKPKGFELFDERVVARKLVGHFVAAMKRAGYVLTPGASDAIGAGLKKGAEKGMDRHALLAEVRAHAEAIASGKCPSWLVGEQVA